MNISSQVTNAGAQTGNMDITLRFFDPKKSLTREFVRTGEGSFSEPAVINGDHFLCLDNSFSAFAKKHVYVDLVLRNSSNLADLESDYQDYFESEEWQKMRELDQEALDEYQMSLDEIKSLISVIKRNVNAAHRLQEYLMSNSLKKHHGVENILSRVDFGSFVRLSMILVTGLTQVVMVKGLFAISTSHR